VPATRDEVVGAMSALRVVEREAEQIAADASKWMCVWRCRTCGRYWAEDTMDSGQASPAYAYPIETDDPEGWLARAKNLF
jgi:hypothetical protein